MAEARLTAGFWVAAYLRRLDQAGIAAFVVARGDETAGAVVVKLATLDGRATLFQRMPGPDGARAWAALQEGAEAEIDTALARQRASDPDLWVIEVEDREGRSLLTEPGLSG